MPAQSLRVGQSSPMLLPTAPRTILLRRAFVFGGTAALTAIAAYQMYLVLDVGGMTLLEDLTLVLFVLLFAWIGLSFVSALGGAWSLLTDHGLSLGIDPRTPLPELAQRTALLMPTYNEPPERVTAGLLAMWESLAATGRSSHFDLFILSDTTSADVWVAEEAAFLALRAATGCPRQIFYRRRSQNTERKAGNIADWVKRFGAAYESMIVLDADSVMEGDALVRLAAAMEAHRHVGLIQTLPVIVGGKTLFARAQQFAGRLYGPLIAHGIAWWHGADGNYWGHNAIIRTQAFAEKAGLPHLRGKPPFGGHILSHDFVEAALIRRGGWAVHMVPGLAGSYEEGPPSLTDLAIRDRRWCQGNLQHIAVLPARGLNAISRIHLLTGIGSYVTAPMWMALLAVGLLTSLQARFTVPDYFPSGFALFPTWPAQDPIRAAWVFVGTIAVLLAPKLVAWLLVLIHGPSRRGFGGGATAFASMLVETLVSALAAPVMMLLQSGAVSEILLGRDAGWKPQRRDDGTIPMRDLVRRYRMHTLVGIVLAIASWLVAPSLFLWMTPVILGLLLAIPFVWLTARADAGRALRRVGLLLIPEESRPPRALERAAELARTLDFDADREAVRHLLAEPELMAAHRAMLPNEGRRSRGEITEARLVGLAKLEDADDLEEALRVLSPAEKTAVLGDRTALDRLSALAETGEARLHEVD
jgi:membrane glycosyltransferase